MTSSAAISNCGRYRYMLWRDTGAEGDDIVLFIMLNPSTADAERDDNTIRRCISFARAWGYARLAVCNLYAYRSTSPAELDRVDHPIGPENEDHLYKLTNQASLIVAAWGARPGRGRYIHRATSVLLGTLYDHDIYCLGRCKNGEPRHPLFVKSSQQPKLFWPRHSGPV